MAESDDDDDHALSDFLRGRLPQVGLDYDTYGPYVLPLLLNDDDGGDEIEEEWDSVMELLQASSESHSDDDAVWVTLRQDIQKSWADHNETTRQREQKEQAQRAQHMEEVLAEERRTAEKAAAEAAAAEEHKTHGDQEQQLSESDVAKRALLDRFGYEDDGEGRTGESESNSMSNQQVAAAVRNDKMKEAKSQNVQSKKDEQAKTAQSKIEKARVKEERRKRTAKGERRRG